MEMTVDLIAPSTELEAVNQMLDAIGESPVNSLENSGVVDAVAARQTLRTVSRRMQEKGWTWNTDRPVTLTPTLPEGYLVVPANCLKVDTVDEDQDLDLVQRGTKLWDRRAQTFSFTRSVKTEIVSGLPWTDLPEAARQYIFLFAARQFQEHRVGSAELSKFNQRDEILAWASLLDAEGENADYNILTDSWGVARVLAR